ncbi:hypothetical protein [Kaarinaea lacus]
MHIVDQLQGLDGKLSPGNSQLLKKLLHYPERQLWDSAKNIIIGNRPIITLNKAVKCVTSANVEIDGAPDPFTVYRALRFSLNKQEIFKYNFDVCDVES